MRNSAGTGLVVFQTSGSLDAIDAHSRRLVAALCQAGQPASYLEDGLADARRRAVAPPWILLQYMPFSYGRWGVAPRLIADAMSLRRRTGARFVVFVHEAWVPMSGWRWTLMSAYQRVQLRLLLGVADAAIATTETLSDMLGTGVVHVPVGSNIMPVVTTHEAAKHGLGLTDSLVVALFGRGHPSRALDYAETAIRSLAAERSSRRLTVLNLGAGAPPLSVPPDIEVLSPGPLDDDELSVRLWASDVLLLPFADGVSTRRGTLMAGLAHGVPVAGLRGGHTDGVLAESADALTLTPVGDPDAFAAAVVELVRDPERLRAAGDAGRHLYAERFDWPVAARKVASVLGS